uniref:Spermatosis associated 22 n=2 Tax=Latimeria chalumnae TaxID=7897 RepID=M3XL17_LATCH|nr:PREDICTED: spermatogenesis-associated protein 22 isoform X1 [Latimeria chalumnae]|eukprot:XP_014354271.1 PREDICTED: spermatogenesis-associated protein 22 isoform X1 [Latimeria chalumnae]
MCSGNKNSNKMIPMSYPGNHLNSGRQLAQQVPQHFANQYNKPLAGRSKTLGNSQTTWRSNMGDKSIGTAFPKDGVGMSASDGRHNFASVSGVIHTQTSSKIYGQYGTPEPHKKQAKPPEQIQQSRTPGPKTLGSDSAKSELQQWQFKSSGKQNTFNKGQFDSMQDEEVIQKPSTFQIKVAEKGNSLRILTSVIEGMKHWSQYNHKSTLLFEVFAMLDSAVTAGPQGAKNFLLRDGKDTVSCVFYETDRELPRLIRGQIHRCVGNYDKKRNLFKCVSVRSATGPEQRAFPKFVKAANAEMSQYIKTLSEF